MEKKGKDSLQASGGRTEQSKTRNQRAPFPGTEKEAAGKNNPNKQKESGKIGSEPIGDDELNRGDE